MIQPIYTPTEDSVFPSRDGQPITLTSMRLGDDEALVWAEFPDGLLTNVHPEEVGWQPCDCGWQYPDAMLRRAARGLLTLDLNPTHLHQPWAVMTPEQEQAWHNGYFRPAEVRETEHGVEWRVQV